MSSTGENSQDEGESRAMQVTCDHGVRSAKAETKIMRLLRGPERWVFELPSRRLPSLQNIREKALVLPPLPSTIVDDVTGEQVDPKLSRKEGIHESCTFTCPRCGNSLWVHGDQLNSILDRLAALGYDFVSIDLLRQGVIRSH